MAAFLDATAPYADSFTSGKKRRMEEAVKALIEEKQGIREKARRAAWSEARETSPAGILLGDLRLAVEHTLYWQGGKRSVTRTLEARDIDAAKKTFKATASFDVPKDAKGPGIYVCKVSIRPFETSRVTRHTIVDIVSEEQPEPETVEATPASAPVPSGDCPVPAGAVLVDEPGSNWRRWVLKPPGGGPEIEVGPMTEWWTPERKTLKQEICYDTNGRRTGVLKRYYSTGKLRVLAHYQDGKLHGERFLYFDDGVTIEWHERYKNGLEHGECLYYRIDVNGNHYLEARLVYENGKEVR
jgi:hypothetical protein